MTLTQIAANCWVERSPTHCPEGHALEPGSYVVGWDGRQRFYDCLRCHP